MIEVLTKLSWETTTRVLLSLNCCRPISIHCTVITTVITYVFHVNIVSLLRVNVNIVSFKYYLFIICTVANLSTVAYQVSSCQHCLSLKYYLWDLSTVANLSTVTNQVGSCQHYLICLYLRSSETCQQWPTCQHLDVSLCWGMHGKCILKCMFSSVYIFLQNDSQL